MLTARVQVAAEEWLAPTPGASVESIDVTGAEIRIAVRTPGDVPPTGPLVERIDEVVPGGFPVLVVTSLGEYIQARPAG